MNKKVILVVPCYNEAERFSIDYWQDVIQSDSNIGWVFVNDGSSDSTGELLRRAVSMSNCMIINYERNLGKGNAIRIGFLSALESSPDCELIGYIDSDGAFSRHDIVKLTNKTIEITSNQLDNSLDAMLSSRVALAGREIRRNPSRHYLGRVVATFLTRSWIDAPYDTQSGFKIFRNTESLRSALENDFKTSWFVDIELLTRIGNLNGGLLNIWEEPLTFWRDIAGSKLKLSKIPKLLIEILIARKEVSRFVNMRGK
jgi:dolichyl-phosphate beta-glucosyltransferase